MKKAVILTLIGLSIASCTPTQQGAGIGAASGAVIGGAVTGNVRGAAVGAAIGGVSGALIGSVQEPATSGNPGHSSGIFCAKLVRWQFKMVHPARFCR
jgi:hypothetical protein